MSTRSSKIEQVYEQMDTQSKPKVNRMIREDYVVRADNGKVVYVDIDNPKSEFSRLINR